MKQNLYYTKVPILGGNIIGQDDYDDMEDKSIATLYAREGADAGGRGRKPLGAIARVGGEDGERDFDTYLVHLNSNYFRPYTFRHDFEGFAFDRDETFDSLRADADSQKGTEYHEYGRNGQHLALASL